MGLDTVKLPTVDTTEPDWGYELGRLFDEYGFAQIQPREDVIDAKNRLLTGMKQFFDQSDDVKRAYTLPQIGGEAGYNPLYAERNRLKGEETTSGKGNPNEYFHFTREHDEIPYQMRDMFSRTPVLPDTPAFEAAAREFWAMLEPVAADALHGMSRYAEEKYGGKMRSTLDHHARHGNWVLRCLNYPEQNEIDPTQERIGNHEDRGLLTLLATDGTPGLQVLTGENPANPEHWSLVDSDPDTLIINTGEYTERVTNGLYEAVKHGAVTVTTDRRMSVPFFIHPSPWDVLETDPLFLRDQPFQDSSHEENWVEPLHVAHDFVDNVNKRRSRTYHRDRPLRVKDFKRMNAAAWEEGVDVYRLSDEELFEDVL